jgi:hypothetical protein
LATIDRVYNVTKYGESFSSDGSLKLHNSVFAFMVGYTF